MQKSADGIVGQAVGEANEALLATERISKRRGNAFEETGAVLA
jgi:hypothetical protein